MAKTPHSLSEISEASITAKVVNHAAHAASGAPSFHGTVVGIGIVVVVDAVAPSESWLGEAEELLQADNTTRTRTDMR
jgi:hypothetical protein